MFRCDAVYEYGKTEESVRMRFRQQRGLGESLSPILPGSNVDECVLVP